MKDRSFLASSVPNSKNASAPREFVILYHDPCGWINHHFPDFFMLSSLIAHNIYPGRVQSQLSGPVISSLSLASSHLPCQEALFPDNPLLPLHTHPFLSIHHLSHLTTILRTHAQNDRPPFHSLLQIHIVFLKRTDQPRYQLQLKHPLRTTALTPRHALRRSSLCLRLARHDAEARSDIVRARIEERRAVKFVAKDL